MTRRLGIQRPLGWQSTGPHSLAARLAQLVLLVATFSFPGLLLPAGDVGQFEMFSLSALFVSGAGVAAAVTMLHQRSQPRQALPTRTDDVSLVVISIAGGVITSVVSLAVLGIPVPVLELFARGIVGALALLVLRGVIRQITAGTGSRRIIVIGTGGEAYEAVDLLRDHPEADLELVGVVGHRETAERSNLGDQWLGDLNELDNVLDRTEADVALVTITGFRAPNFKMIVETLHLHDVEPMLTTGVAHLDRHTLRVGSVVHEPMVSIDWTRRGRAFHLTKRAIDITGALVGLILAAPVFVAAAVAIKLDDRGPVFYRSPRVGRDRTEFGMLKFRSMGDGAHNHRNDLAQRNERSGPLFKISNDPRITRVGRFLRDTSIDEIPQFWNVLRGDMSLVGPRPALPEEAEEFDTEHCARFAILPGVTGLWQVEARSNANFSAYRRLDLHYLANLSIRRDVEILLATFIQFAVVAVTLPFWLINKRSSQDTIDVREPAGVIDLRERRGSPSALPVVETGSAGGGGGAG